MIMSTTRKAVFISLLTTMIEIGDNVNNKIAYMKGTIDNPVITRVLEIDGNNETQLEPIKRMFSFRCQMRKLNILI